MATMDVKRDDPAIRTDGHPRSCPSLDDDAIRCGKELLDQQSRRDQRQEALGHGHPWERNVPGTCSPPFSPATTARKMRENQNLFSSYKSRSCAGSSSAVNWTPR